MIKFLINTAKIPFRTSQKNKLVTEFLILGLITFVAALLRFYKLGEWSLWVDEALTLSVFEDGFNYSPFRQSLALSLIRIATASLGVSEWSARLVPALIGILSIPILFYPIKKCFGKGVSLSVIALLAVSPWHLYWSQNARFYSLLLLLYSLGLLFFFIGLERDNPWYMLSSVLMFGLAARERLLALFFLPIVIGYLLLLKFLPLEKPSGFHRRNLMFFIAPGLLLAAFFTAPYLHNLEGWLSGFSRVNNDPFWIFAGVVYYIGIPIICLALFGSIYLIKKLPRPTIFFGLAGVLPLIAIMGLSPFHYTANRYVFVALTSWIILASQALRELFLYLRSNAISVAIGVLVLVFATSLSEDFLYFTYQNGNRDNWKAAFEFVRTQKKSSDLVISTNKSVADYYLGEPTLGFDSWDPSHMDGDQEVWIVADMVVSELYPEHLQWLERNAQEEANFDVHVYARNFKMRVYRYQANQLISR
jgi:mannosyltransferase